MNENDEICTIKYILGAINPIFQLVECINSEIFSLQFSRFWCGASSQAPTITSGADSSWIYLKSIIIQSSKVKSFYINRSQEMEFLFSTPQSQRLSLGSGRKRRESGEDGELASLLLMAIIN